MKWTPVSERLPSERGEYLVTVNFDGDTYVECFHYGKPLMANREVKGECFYDSDDEWGDVVYNTEVTAWMPLPRPYTADTPQTESTGSPIGDYRDGVGAWQTDCEDRYAIRTDSGEVVAHACPLGCEQTDCAWK